MTEKAKQRLELGLMALAFGVGGGWATYQAKQSQLERDIAALRAEVHQIGVRVNAIYCAQIEDRALREGCNR